jgi:hypothetical protein
MVGRGVEMRVSYRFVTRTEAFHLRPVQLELNFSLLPCRLRVGSVLNLTLSKSNGRTRMFGQPKGYIFPKDSLVQGWLLYGIHLSRAEQSSSPQRRGFCWR